jgi:hypothetical protein
MGVTIAVTLGWLRPLAPIRDAVTLQPLEHMRLVVGPWFVVLAPLYDVWDAMTLLPIAGHAAILAALTIAYVVWRSRVARRRSRRLDWRELVKGSVALTLVLAWYAVGAIAPRPMAALAVDDPDDVVVDFHSHTEASHDGRFGFTAERNREWHRGAGYDVDYITDHGTFAAVPGALARNPAHAGDGIVLLPGFETRYSGEHLNVIGFAAESTYGHLSPAALASFSRTSRPTALLTIPASVESADHATPTDGRLVGIEIVDGSPLGLAFGLRRRGALERLGASLHAALIVGSNNHGWGRTAPGWSVLKIPGWRRLTPAQLDSAIMATLASADRGRVVVVERKPPEPVGESVFIADVARVVRNPFRTLGGAEQLAWVAWIWLPWWVAGPGRARSRLAAAMRGRRR